MSWIMDNISTVFPFLNVFWADTADSLYKSSVIRTWNLCVEVCGGSHIKRLHLEKLYDIRNDKKNYYSRYDMIFPSITALYLI